MSSFFSPIASCTPARCPRLQSSCNRSKGPTGRACSGGTEQPALPQADGRTDGMCLERDCRSHPLLLDCCSTAQNNDESSDLASSQHSGTASPDARDGRATRSRHTTCVRDEGRGSEQNQLCGQDRHCRRIPPQLFRGDAASSRGEATEQSRAEHSRGEQCSSPRPHVRGGEQQKGCGPSEGTDNGLTGRLCRAPSVAASGLRFWRHFG
jgi:hypothetical protein